MLIINKGQISEISLILQNTMQWTTGDKFPAGGGEQLFSRGLALVGGTDSGRGRGFFGQDLEPSPTC